ncbi:MAG: PIG-L family deacetylase [Bacteroidia bacterium]
MRALFIFPHPDDESFGPAGAIYRLIQEGHEVHLLTLTRGGATKERHRLGLTIEEMGAVRVAEMHSVATVLQLTSMEILDLPDSGLFEMAPQDIMDAIRPHIDRVKPHVVVTYPVGGISGFPDHLVCHAVVKQLFVELRMAEAPFTKRLAFFALDESTTTVPAEGRFRVAMSARDLIDCVVELQEGDLDVCQRALDCYATYQNVITSRDPRSFGGIQSHRFFQVTTPPSGNIFVDLE